MAIERWDQAKKALVLQHLIQYMVCMGFCGNMGSGQQNTPSYNRTTDSDMILSSSLNLDVTMSLGSAQASQIRMGLAFSCFPDSDMVLGGSPVTG